MDPISRATLPNVIPATPRVGETAPLAPATAVPASSAAAAKAMLSSTQVDISPLGQFLSGVALSRRQLQALQGVTDEARTSTTPININDDLLALARQLTESFAQLQTSGIDASQLATPGDTPGSLAQRYDLLSGDGTTGAAAALAQDGTLLTQAGLARIGIDLRNEDVDAATLQAAFAADSNATLDALQQGTDVLAQVGAVLARQQGMPLAGVVEADLTGDALPADAALAASATQAQASMPNMPAEPDTLPQTAAIAQRQLEIEQQLETEELNLDMQALRPASLSPQMIQAQQLAQAQQVAPAAYEQDLLQAQRIDSQRVDAQRLDSQRLDTERQAQQQESARVDELSQTQVQQTQLQQMQQQTQRQEQAQVAADEAVRAQLAAEDAQLAARAASERAQSLAREAQAETGLAATAQAQLAQQNAQAQQLAAQNAAMQVPPPSSQDPSVAAAIAAYNLNNAALNPGLLNRPLPASDSRLPLVAPVAPVEPVKPVHKI